MNEYPNPNDDIVTIFEQDGKVYCVISHAQTVQELAKDVADAILSMPSIPRARMRVVSLEEYRAMPFGSPDMPGRTKRHDG